MTTQNIALPFFPKFQTEHIGEGAIRATWFEPRFSQSHYNVHNQSNGSNACTLIAVLMAAKCHQYNVTINHPLDDLNIRLIHLMAISMLEGNRIHEELKRKNVLKDVNLNVPEALKYTPNDTSNLVEWRSSIYMQRLSRSLYTNIKHNYKEWLKWNKASINNLFMVLIADARTVLFLFQRETNTVSLFDSHQHTMAQGAFIAIAMLEHLLHLCLWFQGVVKECYNADPKLYELSFLYFEP